MLFGSSNARRSPRRSPCARSAPAIVPTRSCSSRNVGRTPPDTHAVRSPCSRLPRPNAYAWIMGSHVLRPQLRLRAQTKESDQRLVFFFGKLLHRTTGGLTGDAVGER